MLHTLSMPVVGYVGLLTVYISQVLGDNGRLDSIEFSFTSHY